MNTESAWVTSKWTVDQLDGKRVAFTRRWLDHEIRETGVFQVLENTAGMKKVNILHDKTTGPDSGLRTFYHLTQPAMDSLIEVAQPGDINFSLGVSLSSAPTG